MYIIYISTELQWKYVKNCIAAVINHLSRTVYTFFITIIKNIYWACTMCRHIIYLEDVSTSGLPHAEPHRMHRTSGSHEALCDPTSRELSGWAEGGKDTHTRRTNSHLHRSTGLTRVSYELRTRPGWGTLGHQLPTGGHLETQPSSKDRQDSDNGERGPRGAWAHLGRARGPAPSGKGVTTPSWCKSATSTGHAFPSRADATESRLSLHNAASRTELHLSSPDGKDFLSNLRKTKKTNLSDDKSFQFDYNGFWSNHSELLTLCPRLYGSPPTSSLLLPSLPLPLSLCLSISVSLWEIYVFSRLHGGGELGKKTSLLFLSFL